MSDDELPTLESADLAKVTGGGAVSAARGAGPLATAAAAPATSSDSQVLQLLQGIESQINNLMTQTQNSGGGMLAEMLPLLEMGRGGGGESACMALCAAMLSMRR